MLAAVPSSAADSKRLHWSALSELASHYLHQFDLRTAFATEPERFKRFSVHAPYMLVDMSKNLWDERILRHLLLLAESSGLVERRALLLSGGVVNDTEQRPVLHASLRSCFVHALALNGMERHCQDLAQMLAVAESIRCDERIHDVVHIGIGGSGLGPELALQALHPYKSTTKRLHFVSNMDGHDLDQTLQELVPAHTLFVVTSKSWSTAETLLNARSAMQWCCEAGLTGELGKHFIAITGQARAAQAMGMGQVLHVPEGIGGRFSLWSAVGLPVAIALGASGFRAMLQGAAEMDTHFAHEPPQTNVPVWLGLLDVWYSTFLQLPSRCVAPYHHGLRRLPAYLQQLEMESNGKRVRANGSVVNHATTAALWGEAGSNSQHAFFQWLHQGTQRVPVDILVAKTFAHPWEQHQAPLLANALAQAKALMTGAAAGPEQLKGHQDFPGNRPSTFMVLDDLSPRSFGALLALHEHRVFVSGTVWGINSFDQWGVELGKTLSRDLQHRLATGDVSDLDASTAGLLSALCRSHQQSHKDHI